MSSIFNAPGGSVSPGSDVSFHSTLHARYVAPLKIGRLPQMSRNSMSGSWEAICTELLGEHRVGLSISIQKEQVSSQLTFGSEMQAKTFAVVTAGGWHIWYPDGDASGAWPWKDPHKLVCEDFVPQEPGRKEPNRQIMKC